MVSDWFKNQPQIKQFEDFVPARWLLGMSFFGALVVLAVLAWLDSKVKGESESKDGVGVEPSAAVSQSIDSSPNSAQANVTGNQNVVVQPQGGGNTTVNINSPPAPERLVPMQIAAPPPDLTGREEELKELVDAVRRGGTTISGLRGMGGIGKTALAQKIAQILKADFPDGQIYLDLKGAKHEDDALQNVQPLTASEALGRIIMSFGHAVNANATVDERAALYRTILTNKRALLLMDNARDDKQVRPLMPPDGSVMIVTSRQNFTLPGLFAKNLDTLPPARASELLLKIAPRIGGAAAKLAELCGYLPLALRAVASAIAERPNLEPQDFLRRMSDAKGRLKLTGIDLALTTSSELVDGELRNSWLLLGVFPDTFEFKAAAAVWQCEPEIAEDALSDLFRYSLIEWYEITGRYRLHDLARDFTSLQLDESTRMAAQSRHAAHYKDVLAAANQKYLGGGAGVLVGLAFFDLEWSNIQAGQAWATARRHRDQSAAQLCAAYPNDGIYVLSLRQTPRERIKWLEAALDSARKLGDRVNEGAALGNLGGAYNLLAEYSRAIEFYEQHRAIARAMGDRHGEGKDLGNLGVAYNSLGEHRRAIEFHEQALTVSRDIGDREGEGTTLGNLGNTYYSLGEYHRAIEFLEQALTISRQIGDRHGESSSLGNLGNAYYWLGEYRRAIDFHEEALKISHELGDRLREGTALGNLGSAHYSLGEYRRAIEFSEKQLAIAREIGDRQGEGNALFNSALSLDELGDRAEAIHRVELALVIYEQIESPAAERARARLAVWRRPS